MLTMTQKGSLRNPSERGKTVDCYYESRGQEFESLRARHFL